MLKVIFTSFLLFVIGACCAQSKYKLDKDTSKYKTARIMLLNLGGDSVLRVRYHVLNHESIDSTKVERKKKFVKLYGEKADKGVVTIYLTPGTKILNTNQLLKHFNISEKDMNLPVFIDSAINTHPAETYYQVSVVKSVKIETEAKTNMRYISILSIYPVNRRRLFNTDIYLHGTYTIPETD